jgi:hypothetical protein
VVAVNDQNARPLAPPWYTLLAMKRDETELIKSHTLLVNFPAPGVRALQAEVLMDEAGRLRLDAIFVYAMPPGHMDATRWRSIPIAKIETVLNDPATYPQMVKSITEGNPSGHRRLTEWNDLDYSYELTRKARLRIAKPKGAKYPDDFYADVAAAYYRLAVEGKAPARHLAAANNVPETTVVRWVREARRRGLLAPAGGKGRVG